MGRRQARMFAAGVSKDGEMKKTKKKHIFFFFKGAYIWKSVFVKLATIFCILPAKADF
jgi:hypothetical protein